MANSPITPGQLELLADMIAERLSNQSRCVDKCELARKIGVSVSAIERMMAEKRIPCIRVNRRVVFDIEAVLSALSTNIED